MNLLVTKRRELEHGNVLASTLVFGVVVLIILGSYLKLIQNRSLNRARSLAWNTAIPVAEAGVEEAFTHLHDDTNLTANGWGSVTNGNTTYQKTRTNAD